MHWEKQIAKLGGRDHALSAPKVYDADGKPAWPQNASLRNSPKDQSQSLYLKRMRKH